MKQFLLFVVPMTTLKRFRRDVIKVVEEVVGRNNNLVRGSNGKEHFCFLENSDSLKNQRSEFASFFSG